MIITTSSRLCRATTARALALPVVVSLFLAAVSASGCARDEIRVTVRPTPAAQCPFVAEGTAVVTFGFMDRRRWDFSLPIKPGSVAKYTRDHKSSRLVAHIDVDDKAMHARYTVQVTEEGRRVAYRAGTLPLAHESPTAPGRVVPHDR